MNRVKKFLIEKPLRWACHQGWGKVKGETVFRQLVGPAGALFERLAADRLEEWFATSVKFGNEFLPDDAPGRAAGEGVNP